MCNDLSPKYPSLVKLHDQKVAEVYSRFWFTFYGEDSWMNSGKSPGRPNRETPLTAEEICPIELEF